MILTIILVVAAIVFVVMAGRRLNGSSDTPVETPSTDMSKVCDKDCMDCDVKVTILKGKKTTKKATKVAKKTK